MNKLRLIYAAGCWLFGIACGIGHTLVELGPKPESAQKLVQIMQDFPVLMPGTETDAYTLTFGVSMVMGLMLFAYGVINMIILWDTPKPNLPKRPYLIANVIFSLAAFTLVYLYLFAIPIIFTALAAICFIISLIGDLRKAR